MIFRDNDNLIVRWPGLVDVEGVFFLPLERKQTTGSRSCAQTSILPVWKGGSSLNLADSISFIALGQKVDEGFEKLARWKI